MEDKRSKMLGNMNERKLLMTLSIPAIIGMVVNALYNLVDAIFVAQGAGEIAVGSLFFALIVQTLVMAIALMVGIGAASIFSRAYGAKDYKKMDSVVNNAILVDVVGIAIFILLGATFLDPMLKLFGATGSNIGYAKDYLSIIFFGVIPMSLSMVLNNLARAEGRPMVAMTALIIGGGLNIILDPIFIFDWGLGLGVKGAALATVIAQTSSFIFVLLNSLSRKSKLNISLVGILKPKISMVKEIFLIGSPTFFRNSLGAVLAIIINNLIGMYAVEDPAIYTSIYSVINRVIMFVFMPIFGLVQGLSPIVGFNYGARKIKRVVNVSTFAMRIVVMYFIVGFILFQIFATGLFDIFSKNNDQFFINYGSRTARIISYGFLLVGYQIVLSSVYQALGKPLMATIISLSRQFILFIPLAYILPYYYGLNGLWIAFPIADVLAGLFSIVLYKYEFDKLKKSYKTNAA